jgi:hypothetical protein
VGINVSEEHTASTLNFNPEDGESIFIRNVGIQIPDYMVYNSEDRNIKLNVYSPPHIDRAIKSTRMT